MGEKLFRVIEKIIVFLILILIVLIIKDYLILPKINNYMFNKPIAVKKPILDESKYLDMTATGYTRHIECISLKLDDGRTATNTKVRVGVIAINVNLVKGKWIVDSLLKLGQEVYITTIDGKPIGYFRAEDTGPFKVSDVRGASKEDLEWDRANCDIYVDNIDQAREIGHMPIKVYILN